MDQVALGWLVLEMTDSPFLVGVSAAARMAPFMVMGVVAGALADKMDRRVILRLFTATGGVAPLLTAALLLLDVAQAWHVITLAVVTGASWSAAQTIRHAYAFDIVGPQGALNSMSLLGVSQRIGWLLGAVAAGVIISSAGVSAQFLTIAAVNVGSAVILLATRGRGQAASRVGGAIHTHLLGLAQIVRYNRTMVTLILLIIAIEVLGWSHQGLLPVLARETLDVGAAGLGVMNAASQIGGMLALLLLAALGDFRHKGLLMFLSCAVLGIGLMSLSLGAVILVFLVVLAVVNVGAASADTLFRTLMQANVPNEQRGRAMGVYVVSTGFGPIGHLGAGGMAAAMSGPAALLIFGGALLVVVVAMWVGLPWIRRLP